MNSIIKSIHYSSTSLLRILVFYPMLLILYFCSLLPLYGDAYIAEDRIYYGADSYMVDYEKEIIYAKGHAYFKKQNRFVNADRIEIYYSKEEKKALFFDNVLLRDISDNSEVQGGYAEAFFEEDRYVVVGEAVYRDELRLIKASRIERVKEEVTTFYENVEYIDDSYKIKSETLQINRGNARFQSNVETMDRKTGDTVYCDSITYFSDTENVVFQDDVIYHQNGKDGEDSLIIKSDAIRYFSESDTFILLGDVLILRADIMMRSSLVKYLRLKDMLEASGEIIVNEGDNYIYCNRATYDMQTKKLEYSSFVRGIFNQR